MNRHQRRAAAAKASAQSHLHDNDVSSAIASVLQFGMANKIAGRLADAERCYREALNRQPKDPDALHLLGCLYLDTGKVERGVEVIERAIAIKQDIAAYHSNLAVGYGRLNRLDDAAAAYGRSVDLDAGSAVVLNDYGKILERLGKIAPALAAYAHSVITDSMYAEAHCNLGRMLQKLERFDDAIVSFNAAAALQPDVVEPHCYRSLVFLERKYLDEALNGIERAVSIAPDSSLAQNIHGSVLFRLGRLEESLACFERALRISPSEVEIELNKASTLIDMHRFAEAASAIEKAIALKPDYPEAHNNFGLLCLLRGQFARGWEETEWRWKCSTLKLKAPNFTEPVWLGGEPVAGKTILIHSDQGLGDAINFVRYAPILAAQGAHIILAVDSPLVGLLQTVDGIAGCINKDEARLPDFDVHCPLSSLPLAFGTELDTIPASVPYVRAPDSSKWRARLGDRRVPRVGLVWSGNPEHGNDHHRSLAFAQIAPLLDLPLDFYSLQKGVRSCDLEALQNCERITPLGDEISDFSDTAALLSEFDLLISADTSIAHLAGALAMPVWIMLPRLPDWRWLLDREDSPWYPTMRLFRQPAYRDWDSVIANVRVALQNEFLSNPQEAASSALTARRCNYSLSSAV